MRLKKELNLNLVIEEIKKLYHKENKSFEAFKYNEIKYLLISYLETSKDISLYSRELIIDSVLSKISQEEITQENFISSFKEVRNSYNKQKEETYTVLSSLSIDYLPFRKVRINKSEITIIGKKFPKEYSSSRDTLYRFHHKEPEKDNFLKVIVKVKGKHIMDAFEQAHYDLNIFRGILCMTLNSSTEIPFGVNNTRALNKVKYGFFHSLHYEKTGETVNDKTCWTDKNYPKKITIFNKEKKELYQSSIKDWIDKFNKCKPSHKTTLSNVFNLYVEAFDELDKHDCFLKSWIALECLLGTNDNNLIIKRCLSIYKKKLRPYQKEILKSLRVRRNLMVHENETKVNAIVNCYHVQRYLTDLLRYNNFKYYDLIDNNEEALRLLDLRMIDLKKFDRELTLIKEISKIKKYEN